MAVLDAAGLERPVVVACSMGGQAAIDLALAHPERVAALLLIGTAIRGAPYPDLTEGPTAELNARIEAADAAGDIEEVGRLEAWMWLDGPPRRRDASAGRPGAVPRDERQGAARGGPGRPGRDPAAWPRLGELAVPTLMLLGRLDAEEIQVIDELAAR